MAIRDDIKNDITDTIKKGMKLGLISNPRISSKYLDSYNLMSNKESGINKKDLYTDRFRSIVENEQYAFRFTKDGSLVQFNYEFEGDGKRQKVVKCSLVFLPNPNYNINDLLTLNTYEEEELKELCDFLCFKNDYEYSTNYIRIDYSNKESDFTEFIHPRAHIHIGLINDFRLGISKIPFLSEFLSFILYLYYSDDLTDFWEIEKKPSAEIFFQSFNSRARNTELGGFKCLTENESRFIHFRF